jgi:hypothetical protein
MVQGKDQIRFSMAAFSVSKSNLDDVKDYIEHQKDHQ